MNSKSKFLVFILSVIPGLSHIYLGLFYRGYIFMGAAAAGMVAVLGLCALMGSDRPMILFLGLPVLWFVALIDSMTLADKVNKRVEPSSNEEVMMETGAVTPGNTLNDQNRKIIACLLSVVPGAGHMFLGYQKLGLELMTLFFFSFFFIDWLRIGLFMFIIPVIWFYGIFDALHKASDDYSPVKKDNFSLTELIGEKSNRWSGSKLLGYGLIFVGVLLIFDRIISPLIPYAIMHHLQTGFVSLLFIAGGIGILAGGRKKNKEGKSAGKEALEECENGE